MGFQEMGTKQKANLMVVVDTIDSDGEVVGTRLDTKNQIRCLNLEGDEVHVIERVPDGSVESVLHDLPHDLYASITVITQDGNEIVWK